MIKILLAVPGLDGHDNALRLLAQHFRDAGMEVIYLGIYQTPQAIVQTAAQEDVDFIGLSIHGGAHNAVLPQVLHLLHQKKVNIPSYLVKVGDAIQVKEKSRKVTSILDAVETVARRGVPQWLEVDKDNYVGTVKALPSREELTMPIQEQLVVEFYSK